MSIFVNGNKEKSLYSHSNMDSNIKKYGLENESAWCIEAHKIVNHMYGEHPYEYHLNLVFKFAVQFIELLPETLRRDCLVASWAHDTIEDCRLTYNDVKKVLGENVAEIVYALTNEKGKTRKERANDKYYEGIRNTPGAVYVKLCDRLANIHHSVSINSRMVDVYRKENVEFLHNMGDPNELEPMFNLIKEMIND